MGRTDPRLSWKMQIIRKVTRFGRNVIKRHEVIDATVLMLVVVVVARGWLNSGFPKGHDTLATLSQYYAVSQGGVFGLPGWDNFWYLGTPLFLVFSPLLVLIQAMPMAILGPIAGIKFSFLLFLWLSGLFMYLFVRSMTGSRSASFVAALIYAFSPFTLGEQIIEGHPHGFLAFTLAPLLFWGFERVVKKPSIGNAALCGVFLSLIILSYPQAFPLLIGPFFAAYILFHMVTSFRDSKQVGSGLRAALIMFLVGLGLSAFWWLPLLPEKALMNSVSFAKQDSLAYSATFWQAITLRPAIDCVDLVPSASNPLYITLLEMVGVALALCGLGFNYRNKRAWFFAVMAVVSILLAMGLNSPIGPYSFGYDYLPFWDSIRTPNRFLFFATFSYAVLGGFVVIALRRFVTGNIRRFILVAVLSLLVLGNVWTELHLAFQTFRLSPDQEAAFGWLKEQEDGNYRIAELPFQTWVTDRDGRSIVNPTYWLYLHGKETVFGGAPATATKYAASILESLNDDLAKRKVDMSEWLSIFNVKYVILDKTQPLYPNIILGEGFEIVWTSDTIDIYENHSMKLRIFSVSVTNERFAETLDSEWEWKRGEGSQEWFKVSRSTEYVKIGDYSWKSEYTFDKIGHNWLFIGTALQMPSDITTISLSYYSPQSLAGLQLILRLLESDGSMYDYELPMDDSPGWHEVGIPLSLFSLRYSEDENVELDNSQVAEIWIGVDEVKQDETPHIFTVYFSPLSLKAEKIEEVDFSLVEPGEYRVHLNSAGPSTLILAESYYPRWVAEIDGRTIPSEKAYGFLNSWQIDQEGEHELTLQLTASGQRIAGRVISLLTLVGIACYLAIRWFQMRWPEKAIRLQVSVQAMFLSMKQRLKMMWPKGN